MARYLLSGECVIMVMLQRGESGEWGLTGFKYEGDGIPDHDELELALRGVARALGAHEIPSLHAE